MGLINMAPQVNQLVSILRVILLSSAILFFFWGMVVFLYNAGDSKLREEGKQRMLWSVIALFILLSVFGIIQYLSNTFGVTVSCPNGIGTYPNC